MATVSESIREQVGEPRVVAAPGSVSMLRHPSTDQAQQQADGLLLRMATTLQSSLQVSEIIHLFSSELAAVIPHDQLWLVRDGGPQVPLPRRMHHCRYVLTLLGQTLGELFLARRRPFTAAELEILESVLCALIYPLRNALLYEQAVNTALKDPVTGVNNRAALDAFLAQKMSECARHQGRFALLMLDLDRFKSINDDYGHLAGDAVLARVAACVQRCTRSSDSVFRYGGEEFIVVLSNTGAAGARLLAERVRDSVEQLEIELGGGRISVTVSIGVAEYGAGDSAADLIERADRQLYAAKRSGRNRVCS